MERFIYLLIYEIIWKKERFYIIIAISNKSLLLSLKAKWNI